MHLDVTPEVIVSQLEIGKTDSVLEQAKIAMENTKDFDKFAKHIISLNDKLKHMHAYVALSNSESYFKIKCDSQNDSPEIVEEFTQEVNHFSEKYHVELQKVPNKDVYYIIGKK
ncbi:MAG: hypothetical protein U9Q04_01755 [Campylobacterota bacterium]|nr:hypothetical protein [Campylobacterota bacterium]